MKPPESRKGHHVSALTHPPASPAGRCSLPRLAREGTGRILFTVLFTLATLQLIESRGIVQVFTVALTWLSGLAAVWLLWRPPSSAFFKSARAARSQPPSQISGP